MADCYFHPCYTCILIFNFDLAIMRQSYVVIVVMIMMLMDSTGGQSQYPDCVSCSDGK